MMIVQLLLPVAIAESPGNPDVFVCVASALVTLASQITGDGDWCGWPR
jgi:hypothetical protein